jgi:hypothetical protein
VHLKMTSSGLLIVTSLFFYGHLVSPMKLDISIFRQQQEMQDPASPDSHQLSCKDDHDSCSAWAQVGECTKTPDYMLLMCKRSCKQCLPSGMSWDGYIDMLVEDCKGSCDTAAIIGLDGSKWTTDGHAASLKITPAEASTIGVSMKNQDWSTFQANGIHIAGVEYQFLHGDTDDKTLVLGKKKDQGAIVMQASETAIVIGHVIEGHVQSNGNDAVRIIVEYLESLGM